MQAIRVAISKNETALVVVTGGHPKMAIGELMHVLGLHAPQDPVYLNHILLSAAFNKLRDASGPVLEPGVGVEALGKVLQLARKVATAVSERGLYTADFDSEEDVKAGNDCDDDARQLLSLLKALD